MLLLLLLLLLLEPGEAEPLLLPRRPSIVQRVHSTWYGSEYVGWGMRTLLSTLCVTGMSSQWET